MSFRGGIDLHQPRRHHVREVLNRSKTAKPDVLWRSHCHHLYNGRLILAAHKSHQQSFTLRDGDLMVGQLPHSAILQAQSDQLRIEERARDRSFVAFSACCLVRP
jgi:hypothetical protein